MPIELWWWIEPLFKTSFLFIVLFGGLAVIISEFTFKDTVPLVLVLIATIPFLITGISVFAWLLINFLVFIWR